MHCSAVAVKGRPGKIVKVIRATQFASGKIPNRNCIPPIFCVALCAVLAAGCGHPRIAANPPAPTPQQVPAEAPPTRAPASSVRPPSVQPEVTGHFTERGIASWYGAPFNGRRTSDGETYDMFQYTAAHRTLPFGAVVRVTNLSNGKQTVVRVNDRGPFVANRIIDLSYSAAVALGMIGTGTAPVRIETVGGPNPDVGFFGVQVGAFEVEENAVRMRDRLQTQYSPVTIATVQLSTGTLYRVRVGRMSSEDLARELADRIEREQQVATFVVRLDD
ncbi:MAG TPA: septal ring lytic transglycosylase RlpA family protein [Candidatus Acidoferrales bacterium]|nr:septal ring lytic transglycosylase RlpA family protein [Candidatus Acidoferrales bacterium]